MAIKFSQIVFYTVENNIYFFSALGGHDDSKLYSSAAAAAAAAAAVSSAVPEVASVLSPSQLVGYGRILRMILHTYVYIF